MKTRRYILESPHKTARLARILAKCVDLFLALIIAIFVYPVGVILAIGYLCIADYIQEGQSVGKRFVGFKVVSLEDGTPCSLRQSIIRNLPFTVPMAFCIIPVWGWLIGALIFVPLMLLELFFLYKLDSAHRLGDVMADTTVYSETDKKEKALKAKESWFEVEGSEA